MSEATPKKNSLRSAILISGVITVAYFLAGLFVLVNTMSDIALMAFFPIIITIMVVGYHGSSGWLLAVLLLLQFIIIWLLVFGIVYLIMRIKMKLIKLRVIGK